MTSESNIRELARSRLIAAKVGSISQEELQHWADEQIRLLSEPPDFLLSISMADENELNHTSRLDLVRDKPSDQDAALLAAELLERIEDGNFAVEGLESIGLNCEKFLDQGLNCWAKFSWISDELYLVREGVKDKVSSQKDILETLKSMIA